MASRLNLPQYSFIDIIGIDSKRFLQGQISIDIESVDGLTALLACLCNPKGRIVSLFHITKINDGYRLFMPISIIAATLEHLNKYGVFYKASISEQTGASISYLLSEENNTSSLSNNDQRPELHLIANTRLSLIVTKEPSCSKTAKQDHQTLWYQELIKAKTPWLEQSTSGEFLPHDLNLPALKAVDFKKGCFTGQEVIARMQYKGTLKQHMQLFTCSTDREMAAMTRLIDSDKKVGKIICSVSSKEQGSQILALVKDSSLNSENIQLEIENSPILHLVE